MWRGGRSGGFKRAQGNGGGGDGGVHYPVIVSWLLTYAQMYQILHFKMHFILSGFSRTLMSGDLLGLIALCIMVVQ